MHKTLKSAASAVMCWLALSVSLGWYYTVTYFGAIGWPMPSVETIGALVLYYFSVINAATEIQALHWLAVFPLAGFIWAALLKKIAIFPASTLPVSTIAARIAICSLPLSIPAPYMMYVAGLTASGWQFQRMIDVALRRGNISTWWWLSPMYLALGIAALLLHAYVLRQLFPQAGPALLQRVLLSGIAFVVATAVAGTLASYPLRAIFE